MAAKVIRWSMTDPDILLTNDDGIAEPGLRALYDALTAVGTVTVVAPATNQSAVGRSLSYGRSTTATDGGNAETGLDFAKGDFSCHIAHSTHELGYAIHGTPCDCVILGVHAFDTQPDIVVAGCNPGANLGAFVLGRSGTASAAMEAAFLGVPGIAVSMDRLGYHGDLTVDTFSDATELAAELVEYTLNTAVFDTVDYINMNAPTPDRSPAGLEVTRPSPVYEMDASLDDGRFRLYNRLWEQMADGELPDPPDTDRQAIKAGRVSISPLSIPMEPIDHEALHQFATRLS